MRYHYDTLMVERRDNGVVLVTLHRPERLNAINHSMMKELHQCWVALSETDARVVVLTGSGDRAFCAGADVKDRCGLDEAQWREQHQALQSAMKAMVSCPIPIIAAVNGYAMGGGFELALASDFIVASEQAVFSLPEVKLGIMPGAMGTQLLARACSSRRAKELALTGQSVTANQALEWGIVNAVVAHEALTAKVLNIADQIANNAPLSVRQVKSALNHSAHDTLIADYEAVEVALYNALLPTQDRVEGIAAWNEKRPPQFKGE